MNKHTIFEKIKKSITESMKIIPLSEKDIDLFSAFNDLGLDSLDEIEVLMAIEDVFGIDIPDHVSIKFKTIRDIVDYIEKEIN